MNIVGHMMCRNEADVIEETVHEILRWIDTLVVLDGRSTDGTYSMLRDLASEWARYGKVLDVHSEDDPEDRFADHIRNRLLQLTGAHDPDWVISLDADEIYHYDPNGNYPTVIEAIEDAERIGANVVRCLVPQFWLTLDDIRRGTVVEDESVSVQLRRRWYSWGHAGTFIWRWHPDHYYPPDVPKRTPELRGKSGREWQRHGRLMPICKHYCFRSLRQAIARAHERLERGGGKYFGKYRLNYVIDEQAAHLHCFGERERWQTNPNEKDVYRYMGREIPGAMTSDYNGVRGAYFRADIMNGDAA